MLDTLRYTGIAEEPLCAEADLEGPGAHYCWAGQRQDDTTLQLPKPDSETTGLLSASGNKSGHRKTNPPTEYIQKR